MSPRWHSFWGTNPPPQPQGLNKAISLTIGLGIVYGIVIAIFGGPLP